VSSLDPLRRRRCPQPLAVGARMRPWRRQERTPRPSAGSRSCSSWSPLTSGWVSSSSASSRPTASPRPITRCSASSAGEAPRGWPRWQGSSGCPSRPHRMPSGDSKAGGMPRACRIRSTGARCSSSWPRRATPSGVVAGPQSVGSTSSWAGRSASRTWSGTGSSSSRVGSVMTGAGPFVVTEIRGEAWVPSWRGTDVRRFRP